MPTILSFAREDEGNVDVLLSALVNGYTVEKSPEEKVCEYYASIKALNSLDDYDAGFAHGLEEGVEVTLDILGVKITGINAP